MRMEWVVLVVGSGVVEVGGRVWGGGGGGGD